MYRVIEEWSAKDLEKTLNELAEQGFILKSYQCHKDGNLTNEKHFVIMEREVTPCPTNAACS